MIVAVIRGQEVGLDFQDAVEAERVQSDDFVKRGRAVRGTDDLCVGIDLADAHLDAFKAIRFHQTLWKVGPGFCPDGVTAPITTHSPRVTHVLADRATLRGRQSLITADIQNLPEVTVNRLSGWYSATLYWGVRGYGYAANDRDARSFGDTVVQVEDGDLIHGAYPHAGRFQGTDMVPQTITFHSLIPSTKYVVELVVGEFRNSQGKVVTNDVVSGTANEFGRKPLPVLGRNCFETPADPS